MLTACLCCPLSSLARSGVITFSVSRVSNTFPILARYKSATSQLPVSRWSCQISLLTVLPLILYVLVIVFKLCIKARCIRELEASQPPYPLKSRWLSIRYAFAHQTAPGLSVPRYYLATAC